VAGAPDLTKVTVNYSLRNNGKQRREWSIILERPDQEHAFVSELDHLRQMQRNAAPLVRQAQGSTTPRANRTFPSIVALALGFYLLLHGLPLFVAGLTPPTRQPDHSSSTSRFSVKERSKLKRTVARHFSSPQQFRMFLLVVGGGLTGLGAGLLFLGSFHCQKVRKKNWALTCPFATS
jgi:hypothetical protein